MLPGTPRTFIGSTTFVVTGLRCAGCRRAVLAAVAAVPGVRSVTLDGPSGTMTVSVTVPVDRADVVAAIRGAGYAVVE
jgi:copper chaperone CopZ